MVSLKEIANRIEHPDQVNSSELETLSELSTKYPYTSIFSILYLKALGNTGNIHFEEELKKHSFRIGNRVQLYNILMEADEFIDEKQLPDNDDEVLVEKSIDSLNESTFERNEIENSSDTIPDFTGLIQEEGHAEAEIKSPQIDDHSNSDALDETILHHALSANFNLEPLTEDEEEQLKISKKNINSDKDEESSFSQPVSISFDTKQSFTSWLHTDENYEGKDNADKIAIDAIVNEFKGFNPMNQLFGEVTKPKKDFFSPTKKAKESLDEANLPVSETLAKIYASQGNYPKAIQAYKQLSLNIPEKKIFFANQIKDLTKKLNI